MPGKDSMPILGIESSSDETAFATRAERPAFRRWLPALSGIAGSMLLAGCGDMCSHADGGRYPNPANPKVEAVVTWSNCGATTSYVMSVAIQPVGSDAPFADLVRVEGPTSEQGYGALAGWVDSRTFELRFSDCKNFGGPRGSDLGEIDIDGYKYFARLVKTDGGGTLVPLALPPDSEWKME